MSRIAHPEIGRCWIAVRDVTIKFAKVARTELRAEAKFGDDEVAAIKAQFEACGSADYEVEISLLDTSGQVVTTAVGHYCLRAITADVQPSANEA